MEASKGTHETKQDIEDLEKAPRESGDDVPSKSCWHRHWKAITIAAVIITFFSFVILGIIAAVVIRNKENDTAKEVFDTRVVEQESFIQDLMDLQLRVPDSIASGLRILGTDPTQEQFEVVCSPQAGSLSSGGAQLLQRIPNTAADKTAWEDAESLRLGTAVTFRTIDGVDTSANTVAYPVTEAFPFTTRGSIGLDQGSDPASLTAIDTLSNSDPLVATNLFSSGTFAGFTVFAAVERADPQRRVVGTTLNFLPSLEFSAESADASVRLTDGAGTSIDVPCPTGGTTGDSSSFDLLLPQRSSVWTVEMRACKSLYEDHRTSSPWAMLGAMIAVGVFAAMFVCATGYSWHQTKEIELQEKEAKARAVFLSAIKNHIQVPFKVIQDDVAALKSGEELDLGDLQKTCDQLGEVIKELSVQQTIERLKEVKLKPARQPSARLRTAVRAVALSLSGRHDTLGDEPTPENTAPLLIDGNSTPNPLTQDRATPALDAAPTESDAATTDPAPTAV